MRGGYLASRNMTDSSATNKVEVKVRGNCRSLTLITVDRNVLSGIIFQRIQVRVHSALRNKYAPSRKNRGTGDTSSTQAFRQLQKSFRLNTT